MSELNPRLKANIHGSSSSSDEQIGLPHATTRVKFEVHEGSLKISGGQSKSTSSAKSSTLKTSKVVSKGGQSKSTSSAKRSGSATDSGQRSDGYGSVGNLHPQLGRSVPIRTRSKSQASKASSEGRSEVVFGVSSGSESEASPPLQSDTKLPRSTLKTSKVTSEDSGQRSDVYGSVGNLHPQLGRSVPIRTCSKSQASKASSEDSPIVLSDNAPSPTLDWWITDMKLTEFDRKSLIAGEELPGSIINAAQNLLAHQFPRLEGFQDTMLGLYLQFRKVKNSGVQILHTGNLHWVCISMLNQEVRLMDSLPLKTVEDHLILQIASMYKCDGHILTIQRLPVQIQRGNKDCGVFAIAYALEACIGNDTTAACFDQTRMRDHLKQCLLRGQLRPFPKIRSQIRRDLVLRLSHKLLWYELFCFCQMPDFYDDMVSCDVCSEWVHLACAGISKTKEVSDRMWACSVCRGSGHKIKNKPSRFTPKK